MLESDGLKNEGYGYRHVLGPTAKGHTVHSYLVSAFAHSSPEEWRNRVEDGEVLVNEERAYPDQPVRPGEILLWNRPPWIEEETPQTYGLRYEDANLLVIDKPSGLPTVPGGGFYRNTLVSFVRLHFPSARPLHRLGRATSGLVVFALDPHSAAEMHRRWPSIEKQYQALASSVAQEDRFDIRTPIGPRDHERLGRVWAASPTGKAARTVARVLQRRPNSTVFELDLHTGRPHQIRIHLASIGHPLVGDPLYADGGLPRIDRPGLPGDGGYCLHAKRLRFAHPLSGEPLEVVSPPPEVLAVEGTV